MEHENTDLWKGTLIAFGPNTTSASFLIWLSILLKEIEIEFSPLLLENMEMFVHGNSHCMREWKLTREGEAVRLIA